MNIVVPSINQRVQFVSIYSFSVTHLPGNTLYTNTASVRLLLLFSDSKDSSNATFRQIQRLLHEKPEATKACISYFTCASIMLFRIAFSTNESTN